MAGPLEISEKEMDALAKGAVIELETRKGSFVGYFDRIESGRVYVGRSMSTNHSEVSDTRYFRKSDIITTWLHHQYDP